MKDMVNISADRDAKRPCSLTSWTPNFWGDLMDLIRSSGLDPVANGLLVQLEDRGDLRHGHEVIGLGHQPTLLRLADLVNVAAGRSPPPAASPAFRHEKGPPERALHSVVTDC